MGEVSGQSSATVSLMVNGRAVTVRSHPMRRLLDILREELGLFGTKEGCGEGECGACSVLMDGRLVNSCLIPVIQATDASVETIESVASDPEMVPLQDAFIEGGGAQCGICTPGMIMAAVVLLREDRSPTDLQIRQALSGNLCRCTGYVKVVSSVMDAARRIVQAEGAADP